MQKDIIIAFSAVMLLAMTSCSKHSALNNTDALSPLKQSILMTKSASGIIKNDFSASENDVRRFIEKHNPARRICSLDPVERNGDSLLYIVNYENGWSICSTDKRFPPIVAENDNGYFDLDRASNSGVIGWMNEMMDAISSVRQDRSVETANEFTNLWEGKSVSPAAEEEAGGTRSPIYTWTKIPISQTALTDSVQTVGPYLSTKWGQSFPWNQKLPPINAGYLHYPAGCVAVAVAQLLYYYHYAVGVPSGLYHDITISDWTYYSNPDDSTAYYKSTLTRDDYTYASSRWDQMILKLSDYNVYSPTSIMGANYVSDLLVDVGNRVQMEYDASGNGASSDILKAQAALPNFGLSASLGEFASSPIITNIMQQRPLYMTGFDSDKNLGHAWVLDGLRVYRQRFVTTYEWILGYMAGEYPNGEPATAEEGKAAALAEGYDKPEDGMITHESVCGIPYRYGYHFNWGEDGYFNGYYYNISSLTIMNHHYTTYQQVLYNIHS